MRIAIAGAGICGAYLYRRLTDMGYCPDIYDTGGMNLKPGCGIASCAWLAPNPEIFNYIKKAGLTGHEYILEPIARMIFAGVELKVHMVTIDKPKLIHDLINHGGVIQYHNGALHPYDPVKRDAIDKSQYDLIVDATGTARAYLGRTTPGPNDIIGDGMQMRMTVKNYPGGTAHIIPVKGGYLWVFPIGNNQVHAGIATHTPQKYRFVDIADRIEPIVGGIIEPEYQKHLQCTCHSKVRITGLLPPFYTYGVCAADNPDQRTPSIYGIGEAIGVVSPLTGEGIIPGLQSCDIFLDRLKNFTLNMYTDDINSTFMWIHHERAVLDYVMKTGKVGMWSALILRRMLERCHCRAPVWSLIKIARKMKS
jgi:flavin-dependent dehydrogenase